MSVIIGILILLFIGAIIWGWKYLNNEYFIIYSQSPNFGRKYLTREYAIKWSKDKREAIRYYSITHVYVTFNNLDIQSGGVETITENK